MKAYGPICVPYPCPGHCERHPSRSSSDHGRESKRNQERQPTGLTTRWLLVQLHFRRRHGGGLLRWRRPPGCPERNSSVPEPRASSQSEAAVCRGFRYRAPVSESVSWCPETDSAWRVARC